MQATIVGQVVKMEPRANTYPAKGGRPERTEAYTEVTLIQSVPNAYEKGKTDAELVRVRSFNGSHEKLKVGEQGSFLCVLRAYVPQRGGSPVLTADCR